MRKLKLFIFMVLFGTLGSSVFAQWAVLDVANLMQTIETVYQTYQEIQVAIENVQNTYKQIEQAAQQMATINFDDLQNLGDNFSGMKDNPFEFITGVRNSAQDITKQSGYENLQAKTYQVALVNAGKDHKKQQQAENLLRSFMSEDNLYLLPNGPHNFVLVFMDIPEKQVLSICANSTAMFQKLGSQTLYWGISNVIHQLFDLQEALAQAQQAISNRFYDKREIHLYQPSKPAKIPTYAAQFAALNRCLRSGDQAAGCEILSEIASLQKQKTQPEAQVKETARMILHLCRSALENYGTDLDALDIDEAQWTQELERTQFHHECMQLQTALFCSACQYVSQVLSEGNHLLASVQKYIDRHFCEALTLKDIAAAVHVSPGYLSRFFRQKTGKTIMDTITFFTICYRRSFHSTFSIWILHHLKIMFLNSLYTCSRLC